MAEIIDESFLSTRAVMALLVLPFVRILCTMMLLWDVLPSFIEVTGVLLEKMSRTDIFVPGLEYRESMEFLAKMALVVAFLLGVLINLSNVTYGVKIVVMKPPWNTCADEYLDKYLIVSFVGFGVLGLQAAFYEEYISLAPLAISASLGIVLDFIGFVFLSKSLAECYQLIHSGRPVGRNWNARALNDSIELRSQREILNMPENNGSIARS